MTKDKLISAVKSMAELPDKTRYPLKENSMPKYIQEYRRSEKRLVLMAESSARFIRQMKKEY